MTMSLALTLTLPAFQVDLVETGRPVFMGTCQVLRGSRFHSLLLQNLHISLSFSELSGSQYSSVHIRFQYYNAQQLLSFIC